MSPTSGRFRRQLRARSGTYRFFGNTHFNRFIAIRASHFYYRAFDRLAKFLAANGASSIIFHWLNLLYPYLQMLCSCSTVIAWSESSAATAEQHSYPTFVSAHLYIMSRYITYHIFLYSLPIRPV